MDNKTSTQSRAERHRRVAKFISRHPEKLAEAAEGPPSLCLESADDQQGNFEEHMARRMDYVVALCRQQLASLNRLEKALGQLSSRRGAGQSTSATPQPAKEDVDAAWAEAHDRARKPIGT